MPKQPRINGRIPPQQKLRFLRLDTILSLLKSGRNYLFAVVLFIVIILVGNYATIFDVKYLIFSPTGVEIEGYISFAAVEESGESLYLGKNFFRLDPPKMSEEITASNKLISESSVSKVFPDGIKVEYTLREPFLRINFQDNCYLIDADNKIIDSAVVQISEDLASVEEEGDNPDSAQAREERPGEPRLMEKTLPNCSKINAVPSLVAVSSSDLSVQALISDDGFIYFEQLFLLHGITEDMGNAVVELDIVTGKSIVMLEDGRRLILDFDNSFQQQIERYVLVSGQIEVDKPSYSEIDIRYSRPVLRK